MNARAASVPQRPLPVRLFLGLLIAGCAVYLAHAVLGLGTPGSSLFEHWIVDGIIGGSALVCLHRALVVPVDRAAWAAIGLALAAYFAGDIYWNIKLTGIAEPPYPS